MKNSTLPASFFGIVLGLSGMGQAWRVAAPLGGMPRWIGEGVLLLAAAVWLALLVSYAIQALRSPVLVLSKFRHPGFHRGPSVHPPAIAAMRCMKAKSNTSFKECLPYIPITDIQA